MKTFATVLEELYHSRFTGTITIHVLNGLPRAIELPGPKVELARPVSSKKVDKHREVSDAVAV